MAKKRVVGDSGVAAGPPVLYSAGGGGIVLARGLPARAVLIVQGSGAFVGIDPMSILTLVTTLLPGLLNVFRSCFGPTPTPADVQQHLNAVYDPNDAGGRNGGYDSGTVLPVLQKAKQAARHANQNITNSQLRVLAIATLDSVRLSKPVELQSAMAQYR